MRFVSRLLLVFSSVYACLLMFSVLLVEPHYISSGTRGFLLQLAEAEPEVGLVISLVFPWLWILIPLSAVVLCVLAWVACSISLRVRAFERLVHAGGAILFALSLIPALLVVRQVLIYEPFHAARIFSALLESLNTVHGLTRSILDPKLIVRWGSLAVPIVIFVETGFFFGFFLPGDSLLVTAGIFASAGHIDLRLLIPLTTIAAIAGDQVGYIVGCRAGEALARRYDSVQKHLHEARDFYERHGGKAILIARFVPIARTFAPVVAGAAGMHYRTFVAYNVTGGVFWVLSMTLTGYYLGRAVPRIIDDLYLLLGVIVVISVLPSIIAWIRQSKRSTPTPS